MSSSEDEGDEREERAERAERDDRWAKTHTRWDLVPAAIREGIVRKERVDVLQKYDDQEFRRIFR